MLSETYELNIDENNKENSRRGTNYFPCTCYKGDICKYFQGYLPVHWHRELEMFRLDEGRVRIVGENETFELGPGEGYFSNAGALHGIYPLTHSKCLFHSIVFDASIVGGAPGSAYDLLYVKPFTDHGLKVKPLKNTEQGFDKIVQSFEYAYENCVSEKENYEFYVRNELTEVFLTMKGYQDVQTATTVSDQIMRIKKMITWMEENYGNEITIAMIADVAHISTRECQRSFKEIVHTTPMHYLTNIRISKAMGVLRSNHDSISEIASSTGFGSSSYFSKQFKELTGKTPNQYRQESHR